MPRNHLVGADKRAILLACCCGWLECDMPVGPSQETGNLVNKDRPGGLAGDNLVAATGELDVASAPDAGGDKASFGGRNDRASGLEGKLSDAAIYNRALTADEVANHYKAADVPANK